MARRHRWELTLLARPYYSWFVAYITQGPGRAGKVQGGQNVDEGVSGATVLFRRHAVVIIGQDSCSMVAKHAQQWSTDHRTQRRTEKGRHSPNAQQLGTFGTVIFWQRIDCQTRFHRQIHAIGSAQNQRQYDHLVKRRDQRHGQRGRAEQGARHVNKRFATTTAISVRNIADGVTRQSGAALTENGQRGDGRLWIGPHVDNIVDKV
jgi:hypothetical protein